MARSITAGSMIASEKIDGHLGVVRGDLSGGGLYLLFTMSRTSAQLHGSNDLASLSRSRKRLTRPSIPSRRAERCQSIRH